MIKFSRGDQVCIQSCQVLVIFTNDDPKPNLWEIKPVADMRSGLSPIPMGVSLEFPPYNPAGTLRTLHYLNLPY